MNRKTRKLWILSFIFILFANVAIFLLDSNFDGVLNNENADQQDLRDKIIQPSWENNLYHFVGNNWSAAVSAGWCSGSGTESNPYIIEDLVIDCQDQYTGIEVENSSVYFIIQDCQIDNIGGSNSWDKGIYLRNASNGIIRRNSFTTHYSTQSGIYLDSGSDNNFISENLVQNLYRGIYIYNYCDNNTIYNNHINGSTQQGIAVQGSFASHYFNNISSNLVHNISTTNGIEIDSSSNTTIENNVVYYSEGSNGISITRSMYSKAINNVVYNCTSDGIGVSGASTHNITVEKNYLYNNSEKGVTVSGTCKDIQIIGNTIRENKGNAIYVYADDIEITRNIIMNHTEDNVIFLHLEVDNALIYDNYFIGNTVPPTDNGGVGDNHWNSSTVGNYWDDYGGSDIDGNGIGDIPVNIVGLANANDYLPIYGNPFHDGSIVYINGSLANGTSSWSYVASRAWCSGTGTPNDPYVIEDLVIDASTHNFGIQVDDSENYYFSIENCTVSNAENSGAFLNNSKNGTINNCDISFNPGGSIGYGLKLLDCNVTSITNNRMIGNSYAVSISNSDYTIFSSNLINTSFSAGISISNSNNLTISNNRITDTKNTGLILNEVESTNITNNLFGNNGATAYSLYFNQQNYYNFIYNNTFGYSAVGIAHENFASNDNNWDNGVIGNAWYDYGGTDTNDDGIGDIGYSINGAGPGIDNYPIFSDGIDENGGIIYIDGYATGVGAHNWTWAASKFWCSGSGLENDPYVISDYYLWALEINGNGPHHGIEIENSNFSFIIDSVNITNCTTSPYRAIHLDNVTKGTISNCDLNDNGRGIYIIDCSSIMIIGNNISLNAFNGIQALQSSNIEIFSNSIFTGSYGISFSENDQCQITRNTIYNHTNAGIYTQTTNGTKILENEIYENGKGDQAGIYLRRSTNMQVTSNHVYNNSEEGIEIYSDSDFDITENIMITSNTVENNNKTGILVQKSSSTHILLHIYITKNNISSNGQARAAGEMVKAGIGFYRKCVNNTISENFIANNTGSGIYFTSENQNNTISNNEILNNELNGIYLDTTSHNNTIQDNIISQNEYDGIRLYVANYDNKILRNLILDNKMNGIHLIKFAAQNSGNIITNNTISYNDLNGINIGSHNTILTNNTCTYNTQHGIYVYETDFVNITECTVKNNGLDGIRVESSENIALMNNSESFSFNGQYGIHLLYSNNSNITGNYIEENEIGIFLNWSDDNNIDWNTLVHNEQGIIIENGLGNIIGGNNIIILQEYTGQPISINDTSINNWDWAASQIWCSGSGTEGDPYVITGLQVNGDASDNSIFIADSETFFRIEYCTILNSSNLIANYDAGIHLNNVSNGIIQHNYLYNNCIGVTTIDSDNVTIHNNTIWNNNYVGIFTWQSEDISISLNNISFNEKIGITANTCTNLTIYQNNVTHNGDGSSEFGLNVQNCYLCNITDNQINNNGDDGVYLSGSHNTTITDNDIYRNGNQGISWNNCGNVSIAFNNIYENHDNGIYVRRSTSDFFDNIEILNNTIYHNNLTGIYIYGDNPDNLENLTIYGNNITYNGWAGSADNNKCGIYVFVYCFNFTITENFISNNTAYGIYLNNHVGGSLISDNEIYYHYKSGIRLALNSEYNNISFNQIKHNLGHGIEISDAANENYFVGNTIFNNSLDGINSDQSDWQYIGGNTIMDNLNNGITLDDSHNFTIIGNSINGNIRNGIYLIDSSYNNVTDNTDTINHNGVSGLYLEGSDNNIINNNEISSNQYGVYLNNSNYNTVSNNDLTGNYQQPYHQENCTYNSIFGNEVDVVDGNGGDGNPPPIEPPMDIMIFVIIGIIVGAVAVVGGFAAKGKTSKEGKVKGEKIEEKRELKIKAKVPTTPIPPKGPKKGKKEETLNVKAKQLTPEEVEELQKTEGEVGIEKKENIPFFSRNWR